jgi:hypothetical protein
MCQYTSFYMKTSFVVALGVAQTFPATAAQITGEVKAGNVPIVERKLGYTQTRIVAISSALRNKKEDLALYLEVKNSLPLKSPTERRVIRIYGRAFSPTVTACVVDEAIVFANDDRKTITVLINDQVIGMVEPREELTHKCEVKGLGHVRIKEQKHARATIFVGTTGVASRPDATGRFTMAAPEGTYELKVINATGVVQTTQVEIGAEDIELGLLGAEQTADELPPAETESQVKAEEEAAPPGPKIVIPAPPVIPPPAAAAIRTPPPKSAPTLAAPATKPPPVRAVVPTPITSKVAVPVPPTAPAAAAAKKKPAPAPAVPPPAPKPKPAAEEEESLDDFFEMEE